MMVRVLAVLAALAIVPSATAQLLLPDVDIAITADVRDTGAWVGFYEEVLGSPRDVPYPLGLSVPVESGANRSLNVLQPKFGVQINPMAGSRVVRIVVTGRVSGTEALRALGAFQHAVLGIQSGVSRNELTLVYGLSAVSASIVDLRVSRP